MSKVKYISIFHYCREQDAEYHVRFVRDKKPAETPMYKSPTTPSLKRVAKLFPNLEHTQLSLVSNFVHLQAYTKEQ